MKTVMMILVCLALTTPQLLRAAEQDDVNVSASILRHFENMPERQIPRSLLRNAKGLAILQVVHVGVFSVGGKGGRGVVVARTRHGWSGPAFIATGGGGLGPQIGGQVNEVVLILNNRRAVDAFMRGGNVRIGGELSAAAGPLGRDVQGGGVALPPAAIYTYSRSKGLFAGASLEGAIIISEPRANANYYGQRVSAAQILSGKVRPPARADRLLAVLP
jgi:SH3 domain-containing YSC84-like protein 1